MIFAGYKDATRVTLTQQKTETKAGRLLETILDESTETATPSPAKGDLSMDASPQAVTGLIYSDVKIPPSSLETSLFHETPPELGTSSVRPNLVLNYSGNGLTNSTTAHESYNRSIVQPTPKSVKKSLFEESPRSQEMSLQQKDVTPARPDTQQTPMLDRVPLSIGPSPQLDFWLRPQGGNLDYSDVQATPRSDLHLEETPLESANSSFNGIDFFSRFTEQITPRSSVRTSQPDSHWILSDTPARSAVQPSSVSANSSLIRTHSTEQEAINSELKLVDTNELAERLNRIKQPSLQLSTSGLQHNTSIDPLSAEHSPADRARGGMSTISQHTSETREMTSYPSSSELPHFRDLTAQHDTVSEQLGTTVTTSGAHGAPRSNAFVKDTSFQNVSSSTNEVDTSVLIQRLNKIKLTQLSFSSPHYTPSRPLESHPADSSTSKQDVVQTPSDTSLLASRLDQIKQAQKSQQVTRKHNVYGNR